MNRFFTKNLKHLPKSLNWRERGAVTPVKNQGCLNTCWMMAPLAAIESAYYIKHQVLLNLSHEQLIDHFDGYYSQKGVLIKLSQKQMMKHYLPSDTYDIRDIGGTAEFTYKYAMENDILTVDAFRKGIKKRNQNQMVRIKDYRVIRTDRNNKVPLIQALNIGPVVVNIAAGGEFNRFARYKGGLFDGPYGDFTNHLYDEESIILKNSHGEEWGEKGYMRVARNSNRFMKSGGIVEEFSYPILF